MWLQEVWQLPRLNISFDGGRGIAGVRAEDDSLDTGLEVMEPGLVGLGGL